jgi:uncharacterized protein (TIGR03435 family)
VERATDGLRVRLHSGGVIVNAATQRSGHLYVQTNDMTVSVVGTLFLVNADTQGSRVAVIEGEVRVQQGATEKRLLPGEQLATDPSMVSAPIVQEIAWSRDTLNHLALLQQSAVVPPAPRPVADLNEAFEAVAIRRSDVTASDSGARGGGAGDERNVNQWGCGINSPTIDPSRFAVTKTTIYTLIVWAYGSKPLNAPGCGQESQLNLITGGPSWIRSDVFDVEAVIPQGAITSTRGQRERDEPRLRRMLQSMLAERVRLSVRRESRNVPVYALSVTRESLRNAGLTDPPTWLVRPEERSDDKLLGGALRDPGVVTDTGVRNGEVWMVIRGRNATMSELATLIGPPMGRSVVDGTGLTGRYNFDFWIAPPEYGVLPGFFRSFARATSPTIFAVLAEAGLKLEPSTTSLELLVIDRVERPTQN